MRKPATAENAAGGGRLDLIGVPFDGMGRAPGQAGAPQALRVAGLSAALGPNVVMEPCTASKPIAQCLTWGS
jgi:arginase family enzyme